MIDHEKLIPEIKDWKNLNGESFSIEDWITAEGNIKLAIGYSFIFWPNLIVYDDCVFLESRFSQDNFKNWTETSYIKSYAQIEYVINHIHILDLFALERQSDINHDQVRYLGNILRDIYETKLRIQYPGRSFTVTFNGDEQYEDLIDYEIAFFQTNNENRKTKNTG